MGWTPIPICEHVAGRQATRQPRIPQRMIHCDGVQEQEVPRDPPNRGLRCENQLQRRSNKDKPGGRLWVRQCLVHPGGDCKRLLDEQSKRAAPATMPTSGP
jgi:hypothetical protein